MLIFQISNRELHIGGEIMKTRMSGPKFYVNVRDIVEFVVPSGLETFSF
jgi:hypothetical protein